MAVKCPKCHSKNPETQRFCGECGTQLLSAEEIPSPTKTLETPKEEFTRGTTLANRYEFIEKLGKGGMGSVYRVEDKKTNEELALKLIKPEIAADKKTIERFSNELKLARKIVHKNVSRMYHLDEEEGTHFITMEYVPGEDLKSFIRRAGQLSVGKSISITKQVCEGLAEAHRMGVVHRDLKPQNIMIDKEGNARIMDFGIARSLEAKGITAEGMIIGTPEYMSPEQVEGKEADQRSDIYSLGIILYEMVTGKVPFEGDTPFSIANKHKSEMPKDPRELNTQIPDDLVTLILKCLEKDKGKRYKSTDEVLVELKGIEKSISTAERILVRKKPEEEKPGEKKWKNSIAVLPLEDLSPQKDQEYFCDGMTEALINALTNIKELRVVARTSAFSFKGKKQDVREIGKKLNVETVLEGSMQKADKRIRITAQLINVEDGFHLWSERFDRELEDVFAIQDEISLAIVDKLKIRLLGEEKARLVKRHTENLEAYNLYLKGLYFWNKRTPEGIKKGMELFQQAIESDSTYALAYTGLADAYSTLGFYGVLPPRDVYPKAKAAAQKALELDDTLAEVHASLGLINWHYDWDWSGAENRHKRAIELNPGNAQAHHWYAGYLALVGRCDEAVAEIKRAVELDPLSIRYHAEVGNYLRWSRRLDESIEQLRKTLEMDPNFGLAHFHLGLTYVLKGRYEEAIAAHQKAIEFGQPWAIGRMGSAYAMSGEKDKAKKILHELEKQSKERYVPPTSIAFIYAELGEMDKAFEWLEKAYEERDPLMAFLKTWPEYDSIRSDSRYTALLKKMKLDKL